MLLIEEGKPLHLPDGSVVIPNSGPDGKNIVEVAGAEDDDEEGYDDGVTTTPTSAHADIDLRKDAIKRTLADVPTDYKTMTTVMLVASYTLWGLPTPAIGQILNVPYELIEQIKSGDVYEEVVKQLIEGVRFAETNSVHGYLAQNALAAAQTVVKNINHKKADVALKAASDVLDRAGFRPSDRIEHVHKFEDEMRIRYVADTPTPVLDLQVNDA